MILPEKTNDYFEKMNRGNTVRHVLRRIILCLSVVVILGVFWSLKLTGIGIAGEAFCGKPEHVHDENCQPKTLICPLEETASHTHGEGCLSRALICPLEEGSGHCHEEACFSRELTCQLEEGVPHVHGDTCFTRALTCTLEESDTHAHEEACFTKLQTCTLEEGVPHAHEEACFRETQICQLEETEPHTHEAACWQVGTGFGCGELEENGHVHTEACITEQTQLSCGLEATQGHAHTEACYETAAACMLEEHIHIESCYSDITADLETSDDWEMTLADMVRGPTTRENVVLVARSQLGYRESILNFQVDAQGIRRGITRYGQWYGNPYGDWSAMFASFCLYYAGAEDLPANAGPESMLLEWEEAGLYQPAAEGSAETGNLLFLRKGESETDGANAVAIITAVDENGISVIEGDLDEAVSETRYEFTDPAILGYGMVPSEDTYMAMASGAVVAQQVAYNTQLFTNENLFVLYVASGADYYAFDGNGNAVPVSIDANGNVYADIANPDTLLWAITPSGSAYLIQNVASRRYMHAYPNDGSGVTTSGAYTSTLIQSGSGVRIRSNNEYAKLNVQAGVFQMTQSQSEAAVYQLGMTSRCTVWLDGTDGGMGHLTGSPDVGYAVAVGSTMQLPSEWTSPTKYSYKLRGWYDITNARYYPPGAEMEVTGNAVLYADWVASTYDIGQFNAQVADTVSTNSFITTYMFDYNYLFNIHSSKVESTITASGHTETWSMVTSGTVAHDNAETFDFIFVDNDSGGLLCIPNSRSSHNVYPGSGIVTPDIYSSSLGNLLFATGNCYDPDTGTGVIGKAYLGKGDHLFQFMTDPADEHYGYYYYDSQHNAASYNQSRQRFYVYEYLSGTADAIGSTNSDFLPLNSPYANTNGQTVPTYSYNGVDGEYAGVSHYRYDSKYNSGNYNSENNVQTDYAYGMRTDIRFYLPNEPGSGGNKDLYGNDLEFQFSGDDDLWVLIDGKLVLDIGGIHGAEDGFINFSTGEVSVQGKTTANLADLGITAGDHTMSVRYLERGSSLSNCSIYFNLAPRFGLQLQKEDVLTQELLDGTQFTVYEDLACTQPVELWASEAAYSEDLQDGTLDQATNSFTVVNGVAKFWGLGSGNTYYIKETGPPNAEGYGTASGVIRLTIEKEGLTTYKVDVIPDAEGNAPSNGFTVHGVRIDEETKTVYFTVTNAPESVIETTTVQVIKKWEDTADHSDSYIQAYLTVTDPDGTVRRIREISLSDENDWTYTWTNLPKYDYDALTEVKYGIEESYESGYYSTVRRITEIEISRTEWAEAASFINGESYILQHSNGYLSTTSASDAKLKWVNEATAQSSPLALWTATVSSGKVKFTNGAGQILTFNYGTTTSGRYFYATTGSSTYQSFTPVDAGSGFRFYITRSNRNYYMSSSGINNSGRIPSTTSSGSGLILLPMKKMTQSDVKPVEDWAYQITNTPLAANNETSLAVKKIWSIPAGYDSSVYEEFEVTVRLLANGVQTGRSMTLNLKNNWEGSFLGLPYTDDDGNVIHYSVTEVWHKERWTTTYGEIVTYDGSPPVYSTTITNTYYEGGPELPSTGSAARIRYMLCGAIVLLGTLVYGIGSRRKRERRFQ